MNKPSNNKHHWQLRLLIGIGSLALILTLIAAILSFFANLTGNQRFSVNTNRSEAADCSISISNVPNQVAVGGDYNFSVIYSNCAGGGANIYSVSSGSSKQIATENINSDGLTKSYTSRVDAAGTYHINVQVRILSLVGPEKLFEKNSSNFAAGGGDEQYIGGACTLNSGTKGTCQYQVNCQNPEPGRCPGSSNVQCCPSDSGNPGGKPVGATCTLNSECASKLCSAPSPGAGKCVAPNNGNGDGTGDDPGLGDLPGIDLTVDSIFNIIYGFACWLWSVSMFIIVIAIIWVGIRMMGAQANPTTFTSAKTAFKNVLLGAIVIMGVYVIIATVANGIGVDISLIPFDCSSGSGGEEDLSCEEICNEDAPTEARCNSLPTRQDREDCAEGAIFECQEDCDGGGGDDGGSGGGFYGYQDQDLYCHDTLADCEEGAGSCRSCTSACTDNVDCTRGGAGSSNTFQLCGSSAVSGNASQCIPSDDCQNGYCYDASGSSVCGSTKFPSAGCRRDKNGNPIP